MPRHSRLVIPNTLHHVTQRGNHREQVFFDDEGRHFFMEKLCAYAAKAELQIGDYCLMDNHTHLLVVPLNGQSLAKTFKPLHMCYSQFLNKRFGRVGLNWQGRFFSSPLDQEHAWNAFQYVALNPVEAGLADRFQDYRWSAARGHLELTQDKYITASKEWRDLARSALVELGTAPPTNQVATKHQVLERNVHMNLPCGAPSWVEGLERQHGRKLTFRPRGQPPKGRKG